MSHYRLLHSVVLKSVNEQSREGTIDSGRIFFYILPNEMNENAPKTSD